MDKTMMNDNNLVVIRFIKAENITHLVADNSVYRVWFTYFKNYDQSAADGKFSAGDLFVTTRTKSGIEIHVTLNSSITHQAVSYTFGALDHCDTTTLRQLAKDAKIACDTTESIIELLNEYFPGVYLAEN